MPSRLHNTAHSYGSVAKALHWITALLILTEIPLGFHAADLPVTNGDELSYAAFVFSIHKTLGVSIFFVALLRIFWALFQPRPGVLHPDRSLENFVATTVHWSLYIALVLVPLTGWISHAASSGFAPIWWPFGQTLPFVGTSEGTAETFAILHDIFGKILAASILLHVAGALKHVLIDRDGTFARMSFGPAPVTGPAHRPKSAAPILAAVGGYSAALIIGVLLGFSAQPDETDRPSVNLPEPAAGWGVQEGTVQITVQQLGSEVTGGFEDWSASVDFDPASGTGTVDVTISVASLTLGSVSAQALGAEFFDAVTHPTARFIADITPDGPGFTANGDLTIKGATLPATLPFDLSIEGNLAHMTGSMIVNRTDFGIGESYPDEKSVGFDVKIDVNLTAEQPG